MTDFEQANIRVPVGARDVLRRLGRLLRDKPGFLDELRDFLAEKAGISSESESLADRVADLEHRIARLEGGEAPASVRIPEINLQPLWVSGEGRGRRLTEAGLAEVDRRIDAGDRDGEIARDMRLHPNTVASRRRILAGIQHTSDQPN